MSPGSAMPRELVTVDIETWDGLCSAFLAGEFEDSFEAAFENGRAFLRAAEGLRGRSPFRAEWKGPHRSPGDDVIPADLRLDWVYLVSCKYLSKILLNPSPPRLFERQLTGEQRSQKHWFLDSAGTEFQQLYSQTRNLCGLATLPARVDALSRDEQRVLKASLKGRSWPEELKAPWAELSEAVAAESARRWRASLGTAKERLRLLWKMLRISGSSYFVVGSDRTANLRLRVDSTWDWAQAYELANFEVCARPAGQPEVAWAADVVVGESGEVIEIRGHAEIRWSHGRFLGSPEAKLYLDTPLRDVPGYHRLH